MRSRQEQRGAALLIVLVLVASVTVIAFGIASLMERTANKVIATRMSDEAYWAMVGAERLALGYLDLQSQARNGVDLPSEQWLSSPFQFPVGNLFMSGRFFDRSACFNIHDLVNDAGDSLETDEAAIERFGRFIAQIGGDINGGELLGAAAADFMDTNSDALPGGAEDFTYTRGEAPYRTAGTWLADTSELRAVEGWTAGITRAIEPWLCTRYRNDKGGGMNLNTMTEADAPLLRNALNDAIPLGQAERLIASRPPDGYTEVDDFLSLPAFTNLNPPFGDEVRERFSTEATLIEWKVTASTGNISFSMTSVIEKGTGSGYRVTSRYFGPVN